MDHSVKNHEETIPSTRVIYRKVFSSYKWDLYRALFSSPPYWCHDGEYSFGYVDIFIQESSTYCLLVCLCHFFSFLNHNISMNVHNKFKQKIRIEDKNTTLKSKSDTRFSMSRIKLGGLLFNIPEIKLFIHEHKINLGPVGNRSPPECIISQFRTTRLV